MAQRKTATVISTDALSADTRLVAFRPAAPLGFTGGQYLIVDSGVILPGGKVAKRAYSILSSDAAQDRFEIAVKRIGDGAASSYLHRVQVGDEVPFSGPWGQYLPEDSRPRRTLVLATDSGITAALGRVAGRSFAPQRATTELVWARCAGDFLPEAFVRERVPALGAVRLAWLPPVGHPERLAAAMALASLATEGAESVYLSGDGDLLYPLRDRFARATVRLECFFNNPAKKSA
jgi:ferredoxin-NADP reductase